MKTMIKWVLAAFIGSIASFLLVIISQGVHVIITCGIVAMLAGLFLYYAVLEKSELRLLLSIALAIVAFILYLLLYMHVDENAKSFLPALLVFFAPYIVFAYLLFGMSNNNNDQGEKTN